MRAYPGTTFMGWLQDTPSACVNACMRMLPRLDAEASIARINGTSMAFGTLGDKAHGFQQTLMEAVAPEAPPAPRRGDPSALIAHGFMVRRIPKAKAS